MHACSREQTTLTEHIYTSRTPIKRRASTEKK
jgi:hypothetical protein